MFIIEQQRAIIFGLLLLGARHSLKLMLFQFVPNLMDLDWFLNVFRIRFILPIIIT